MAGKESATVESYRKRAMAGRALIATAEPTKGSRDSSRGGAAIRKAVSSDIPNHRRHPSA
jgi:hypothetical protein